MDRTNSRPVIPAAVEDSGIVECHGIDGVRRRGHLQRGFLDVLPDDLISCRTSDVYTSLPGVAWRCGLVPVCAQGFPTIRLSLD